MVKEAVKDTISIVKTEETSRMNALTEKGHQIKTLADRITEYLALLFSSGTMTEQQASQTASLMYVLSDVERIGTLSVEIAGCIQERQIININIQKRQWMSCKRVSKPLKRCLMIR